MLTDYAEPEEAILEGIRIAAGRAGVALSAISQVIHGTTLATNALIERRGARTAFVTTEGFRDVIEMRTENRFEQYDLNLRLPDPLVPREHRLTVAERMSRRGQVLLPLDDGGGGAGRGRRSWPAATRRSRWGSSIPTSTPRMSGARGRSLQARAARAVDVALLESSRRRCGSCQRFNTVCANAYVQPQMADYLGRLHGAAEGGGRSGARSS